MTPPCYTFGAAELADRVQLDVNGRQRKKPVHGQRQRSEERNGGEKDSSSSNSSSSSSSSSSNTPTTRPFGIDLARDCALLASMVQYSCAVAHPHQRDSPVRCWPVQRFFRRCRDKSGSFTVETTAWEGGEEQISASSSSKTGNSQTTSDLSAKEAAGTAPSPPPPRDAARIFA